MDHNLIWKLVEYREYTKFDEVEEAEHLTKQVEWGYTHSYNNIHVDIVILLEKIAKLNNNLYTIKPEDLHDRNEVHMGMLEEIADVYIETSAVAIFLGLTPEEFEERKPIFASIPKERGYLITHTITIGSVIQQSLCKIIRGKEVDKEKLLDDLAILCEYVKSLSRFFDSDFPIFWDVVDVKLTRIASRIV